MWASFAPVEAWSAKGAPPPSERCRVDAELAQKPDALSRYLAAILGEHNLPPRHECVGKCDAEFSRKMIVAGASRPQCFTAFQN